MNIPFVTFHAAYFTSSLVGPSISISNPLSNIRTLHNMKTQFQALINGFFHLLKNTLGSCKMNVECMALSRLSLKNCWVRDGWGFLTRARSNVRVSTVKSGVKGLNWGVPWRVIMVGEVKWSAVKWSKGPVKNGVLYLWINNIRN